VSYSIGQSVYTTNTGTGGSVSQGVQQPYEIMIVSGFGEVHVISLTASVYPNPTSDIITLKVENYTVENLGYYLYDINGALLENKRIESNKTNIVMSNLPPAVYFLKVTERNEEIKAFKIIKN
jgi:hypothetical protein